MTSGAGDSLQTQGVNNDSPFENKDGAKASGNNTYGAESRHDTQEAVSPFTIPKLKRSKQGIGMIIWRWRIAFLWYLSVGVYSYF